MNYYKVCTYIVITGSDVVVFRSTPFHVPGSGWLCEEQVRIQKKRKYSHGDCRVLGRKNVRCDAFDWIERLNWFNLAFISTPRYGIVSYWGFKIDPKLQGPAHEGSSLINRTYG
jgi:hypothetical protein